MRDQEDGDRVSADPLQCLRHELRRPSVAGSIAVGRPPRRPRRHAAARPVCSRSPLGSSRRESCTCAKAGNAAGSSTVEENWWCRQRKPGAQHGAAVTMERTLCCRCPVDIFESVRRRTISCGAIQWEMQNRICRAPSTTAVMPARSSPPWDFGLPCGSRSPGSCRARAPGRSAPAQAARGLARMVLVGFLATQVERLGPTLRARGLGAQSLAVVSGQYAPNLLLFALAAARQGAWVTAVPAASNAATLAGWLERSGPDLVFLGARDQFVPWAARSRAPGGRRRSWWTTSPPGTTRAGPGSASPAICSDRPRLPRHRRGPRPTHCGSRTAPTGWTGSATCCMPWPPATRWPSRKAARRRAATGGRRNPPRWPSRRRVTPPCRKSWPSACRAARRSRPGSRGWRWRRGALAARRYHRLLLPRLRRPLGLARLRALTVVVSDGDPPRPRRTCSPRSASRRLCLAPRGARVAGSKTGLPSHEPAAVAPTC